MTEYKVNWPVLFTAGAISAVIFTCGVLLGALINDEGTVSMLQALAWLGAGGLIGIGIGTALYTANHAGKDNRHER